MGRSLKLLLGPLISPRAGFRRFLDAHGQVDAAALPLFSLLLLHFGALLLYAQILRRTGGPPGEAAPPLEAAGALTAAVPFIGSLWLLVALLLWGLLLWAAGFIMGSRRAYGEWLGLAALCHLPEVPRVLTGVILALAGAPGALGELPVDPFGLWEAVLVAFGFAAYAGRPLWAGATVGAAVLALQLLLRLPS
ncbi:MAG TPA: YIP1 family protein [Bacillota bacterium]